MATPSSPIFPPLIIFLFFISSVAHIKSDISIINYDQPHMDTPRLRSHDELIAIFESWLAHHRKTHSDLGEKERRFQLFKDNLKFIDEHNADANRPYKVGLNRFADRGNEEYRLKFTGTKPETANRNRRVSHRYSVNHGGDNKLPTACDDYFNCPSENTCCCLYDYGKYCFGWGCCPLNSATCCDDHYSCCPHDYPVCDLDAGACIMSKNSPIGVEALKRTPATWDPNWPTSI